VPTALQAALDLIDRAAPTPDLAACVRARILTSAMPRVAAEAAAARAAGIARPVVLVLDLGDRAGYRVASAVADYRRLDAHLAAFDGGSRAGVLPALVVGVPQRVAVAALEDWFPMQATWLTPPCVAAAVRIVCVAAGGVELRLGRRGDVSP
jgi:hypothetical protein